MSLFLGFDDCGIVYSSRSHKLLRELLIHNDESLRRLSGGAACNALLVELGFSNKNAELASSEQMVSSPTHNDVPASPVAAEASLPLTARFKAVIQSDPLILMGHSIPRIELVSHSGAVRFLVNAHDIWQLSDCEVGEQTERFVAEHSCPDDYVFCRMTSLARLALSDTASGTPALSPGGSATSPQSPTSWFGRVRRGALYVDGALLMTLLTAPDGRIIALRPSCTTLELAAQNAVKRHCSVQMVTGLTVSLSLCSAKCPTISLPHALCLSPTSPSLSHSRCFTLAVSLSLFYSR